MSLDCTVLRIAASLRCTLGTDAVAKHEGTNVATHDTEAFRFPEHHDPVPGLTDEVDQLWKEGRHRSALDAILRFLRTNGKSAEAFRWALPLLRITRTPDPSINEPITKQQLRNAYFAPIATECARCLKVWYSSHVIDFSHYESVTVLNPMGQQCQVCRYTLCRDCFTARDARCPEPECSGELGLPVLPTGRPRGMPANQHTEKIEHVLILWHGTPTSQEEIIELVDLACTWQDCGGITVRSDEVDESDLRTEHGQVLIAFYGNKWQLSPDALERTRVTWINSPGLGKRLLLITSAPTNGPASQLSGPIRYVVSSKQPRQRGWFRRTR